MKERYEIIKEMYPTYIIIFKTKNNYISIEIDKQILEFIKHDYLSNNVNYLILDNLEIIAKKECLNNKYVEYYIKTKISLWLKSLDYFKQDLSKI